VTTDSANSGTGPVSPSGVLPGAEPFEATPDGGDGRLGVLLCHGFTGSPQSLRPWAQHLVEAGFRVSLPRLPGHGTHWRDLQSTTWEDWYAEAEKALLRLLDECNAVFVGGLSMGGGLALRLAEVHGDAIRGVAVVNPSVKRNNPREALIPLLARFVPSMPGIASDIKRPGPGELAYDKVPLKAALSLTKLWATVEADLPKVTAPLLLFRSPEDHVVHPSNSALVLEKVGSTDVTEVLLPNSYHVATLDNDAPTIFADSAGFFRRLAAEPARAPDPAVAADGSEAPV
jgi:carboxylesterase